MTDRVTEQETQPTSTLVEERYWPARAAEALREGKYSRAVEICREGLVSDPELLSGRLIYAAALLKSDQLDSASEQFYTVLSLDPENLVALKSLGDIKMKLGDELGGIACYRRVLEIDPLCRGVKSDLCDRPEGITRTVTLHRHTEEPVHPRLKTRMIPFYTETIGDLYLAQGHPRLAAEVFRSLITTNTNSGLQEKLKAAEKRLRERESKHARYTND